MIKLRQLAGVAIAAIALCACEEDTALSIGSSLTNESDKLIIDTLTFQVSTRTVVTDSVLSLSNNCYFGRVTDPETNTNVTSEFTTQFNVLENNTLLPADSVVSRWTRDGETTSMAAATSCDIIMYPESPFRSNDSLISMKMQLMELSRPLEEGERY